MQRSGMRGKRLRSSGPMHTWSGCTVPQYRLDSRPGQ